jgi:pyrimidine-specific ribonucleoside hydrolase
MKRKYLIISFSLFGVLLLVLLSGPLLERLGYQTYYIQSDGKSIKIVRGLIDPESFPTLEPGIAPTLKEGAIPVIIDTDMAGDDWMAILYLLQHPDVNIIAITVTGTGEAHCGPGVRHALDLLMLAGRPEVPVACGRSSPLSGDHAFPMEWRNRVDNLFDLSLPRNPNSSSDETAPNLIIRLMQESAQKIYIVALGPLTNIAEAVERDPDLEQGLQMLTIMGGAINVPGNVGPTLNIDNPHAEWNIYADPHAAKVVFGSVMPITLVPLDATQYVPITMEFYKHIKNNRNTPVAEFIYRTLTQKENDIRQGWYYFWDPLAAAIATEESLTNFQEFQLVVIEEEGSDSGRILESNSGRIVRVAIWADAARFEQLFLDTLNGRLP